MELEYKTRNEKGENIIKQIKIKEFPTIRGELHCSICGCDCEKGHIMKKCVSSSFTDWALVGDYICCDCARLLSLYFYSYSYENKQIHIFNQTEIKENLFRVHETPFKFCITTSKKKHLFYRAIDNYSDDYFAVQLEMETIYVTRERLKVLFDFVENLLALGATKTKMLCGELPFSVLSAPYGAGSYKFLNDELTKSRIIQIPLFCGIKREVSKEEAEKCIMDLIQ